VFGFSFSFSAIPLQPLLMALGISGIFIASTMAIYQTNIKRLFAYSSIAQIGYMMVGFSLGSVAGLTASLLHLFNHALMKSAIFLALAAVVYRLGHVRVSDFQGLGRQMPITMAALVIGSLSLIGVPLTVGFISKWYLLSALLDKGWWMVAVLVLLGSLLALVYAWKVVEAAYFKKPIPNKRVVTEAPLSIQAPLWILIFANIYFGIDARLSVQVAQSAAQSLFGVSL